MDDDQHIANSMPTIEQLKPMQESCQALKADGRKKGKGRTNLGQRKVALSYEDLGKAIIKRAEGKEIDEIAVEIEKTPVETRKALEQIKWLVAGAKDSADLKAFREAQLDILETIQAKILGLVLTKLNNSEGTLRELTYTYKELFTSSRLLQGKVTSLTGELRFTAPPELTAALTNRLSALDVTPADALNSDVDEGTFDASE